MLENKGMAKDTSDKSKETRGEDINEHRIQTKRKQYSKRGVAWIGDLCHNENTRLWIFMY